MKVAEAQQGLHCEESLPEEFQQVGPPCDDKMLPDPPMPSMEDPSTGPSCGDDSPQDSPLSQPSTDRLTDPRWHFGSLL